MTKPISTRFALGSIDDLTTADSTQKYTLGKVVEIEDSAKKTIKKFMYVKSHGTLVAYTPYVLNFTGTSGSEVKTAAPVTTAAPGQFVVVPQIGVTSGYYCWVQVAGDCTCLLTNETIAAGDYLQILNTGAVLAVDGTSGATVLLANSCAVSKDALYVAAGNNIVLLGRWAVTAAS